MKVYLQNLPLIRIGGRLTKSELPVHAAGCRHRGAVSLGAAFEKTSCARCPISRTSTATCRSPIRTVKVEIDRDKASALGVTAEQIEDALYNAYGSRQVSTIYTPSNEYWVILELAPQYQASPEALSLLYVRSSSGAAGAARRGGEDRRAASARSPSATWVSCRPSPSPSTSSPGSRCARRLRRSTTWSTELRIPPTVVGSFQGAAQPSSHR